MIDFSKVIPIFKNPKYKYAGSRIITTRDNNGQYRVNKPHKDYSTVFSSNPIRVPSLKRNKRTWKNFYKLFPQLKGLTTYYGIKLKQIK